MSDKAIKLSQAKTLYDDLRGRVEDQIIVSSTEPQETNNELWINNDPQQEITIPTYAELQALSGAISVAVKEETVDRVIDTTKLRSDLTAGIMSPTGSVTSSTSAGYLTTPMEVEPGEILTAQVYYLNSHGEIAGLTDKDFRGCAFFTDSTYTYANRGFSSATANFTVPDDIHYIQPTFSGIMTGTYTHIIIRRTKENGQIVYELQDSITEIINNESIRKLANGNLTTKELANQYGCALPKTPFRMTVGIPEKWYKKSMVTPPTDFIFVAAGYSTTTHYNDSVYFENASAVSSTNGYMWEYYDPLMALIEKYTGASIYGNERRVLAENLSNCSLLAIGDSTVDHDKMTAKLLSYFTEKNKTITLLGTLGSATDPLNKNEGRAGWTTTDYMGNTTKNGYTNPFWNPTTGKFDFSYYMSQQGYSAVDFVVIQLGINDFYLSSLTAQPSDIGDVWENIKTMIDSILAYNASTKVIVNLPTTPNSNESTHYTSEFLYRNNIVRYNGYALEQINNIYQASSVRSSYCHLILDPATEIRDNVHPTDSGYEKMAMEVINQINVWQNGY